MPLPESAPVPDQPAISTPTPREAPWLAGLHAARANLVPGLIVQTLMLALLLAYYFYPPTRNWLDALAEIKARWSYGYSAMNSLVAGAIIPELLRILLFQGCKFRRANFSNMLFTVPFWCTMGMIVDFFYRCQAGWFGQEATFLVILKKVLVDQFLYNPLFACPVTTWLYDWKTRGFETEGTSVFFTVAYYRDNILPTLLATWGVWIPVVSILYSLPSLLQIPLFGLALSLWVMLYTWMSEQRSK
ncbi:MAG: hypothetical protein ABI600_00240 [Luteolibacter sp.]